MSSPTPSDDLAIRTRALRKRFGDTWAVDGLDLAVPRGTFFGLLGPNGAGKSTTIGLLTGTLRPTSGAIEILGRPLDPDEPRFKRSIGVVSEVPALFDRLRGDEQLVLTGRLFGLDADEASRRTAELLALLRLDHAPRTLIADYSRGMRKKLAIGCALIHAPPLLFFDEPFEGVDATSAETIRRLLVGLTTRGATVLLTTHILEVAEKICQEVGIIHRGQLAAQLAPEALHAEGRSLADAFHEVVGIADGPLALPAWLVDPR